MTPSGLPRAVAIHYLRPPGRVVVYRQWIVHRTPEVIVTFQPRTELPSPVRVDGRVVLEDGAPAVWFTFPGVAHDIGRFHDREGRFTGIYANVLTPVEIVEPPEGEVIWRTTDLYLDIFRTPEGAVHRLDVDELDEAEASGRVDRETARAARTEADRIEAGIRLGSWPPPIVEAWTLERASAALDAAG